MSHRSNIAQIHCPEFTETNSYFYSFTYIKNIFSSSSYQWGVGFFVNLLTDRKVVDSTPKYSLLVGDTNQVSIYFSLHKIQMSKQHRLIN